ncbi:unnamed protein product [Spirodela intermedia]|uniref:Uncharacterized protein n=1 Tax=Spirodela intermedia TaxID=51605 RepID=A0A7I8JM68_SPIIN|nr:unnamed protein product [Spirodela intermedia]CAA6671256.1 unnamed protein product [Spirodela intermedia]
MARGRKTVAGVPALVFLLPLLPLSLSFLVTCTSMMKDATEDPQPKILDGVEEGKERVMLRADWTRDMISRILGWWRGYPGEAADLGTENAEKIVYEANDHCVDRESAATQFASEQMGHAEDAARYVSAKVSERVDRSREALEAAYREAMEKEVEAYKTATETLTEAAKVIYEEAKERMSQATGDLGAEMLKEAEL